MSHEPHVTMSDSYSKSIVHDEKAFRRLYLTDPPPVEVRKPWKPSEEAVKFGEHLMESLDGEVIRLDSHGDIRDLISQINVHCRKCGHQFWEAIPNEGASFPNCPKCNLRMRIGDLPPIHSDILDALALYEVGTTKLLVDAEKISAKFHGHEIAGWAMDDPQCDRMRPRERLTSNKERTSTPRLEKIWNRPSECRTTRPLPKMTART